MENNMIQTEMLTKYYQLGQTRIQALQAVSLLIPSGQFVSVMGKSGSGKSTLLHLIGGLDNPTSGKVWVGGQEISNLPESRLSRFRRRHLGFVFQFFNLIPELSLRENIIFPALLDKQGYDHPYFDELCEILELTDRLEHRPGQVSGGQQQRAAIARSLILKPSAVLLDEPTGNLDTASAQAALQLLRSLCDRWHQTVVLVTHDKEAAQYADLILQIKDGQLL